MEFCGPCLMVLRVAKIWHRNSQRGPLSRVNIPEAPTVAPHLKLTHTGEDIVWHMSDEPVPTFIQLIETLLLVPLPACTARPNVIPSSSSSHHDNGLQAPDRSVPAMVLGFTDARGYGIQLSRQLKKRMSLIKYLDQILLSHLQIYLHPA